MEFHTLDVFTTSPYSGNPLAVVLEADNLTTAQMQTIAAEFNLSETIFVQQPDDPAHTAKVRIFFPTDEIPFAGHPTVGCAILLAEQAHQGDFNTVITLEERAGLVPVNVIRQGGSITAEFTAPVIPHRTDGILSEREFVAQAFDLAPSDIGFTNHECRIFQGGPTFIYVPIASRSALQEAKVVNPNYEDVCQKAQTNSIYLYCRDGDGFAARMFAPGDGIYEDPATGSASAIFAAQLLATGELDNGSNSFELSQGHDMGRPSQISLTVDVSGGKITAICIKGSAVRVSQGVIRTLPLESGN